MKHILRLLLAVTCLALLLCSCGKEKSPPPESYPITADETLPALTQVLSEQERTEVSYNLLEQGEGEEDLTSHQYTDLSNSGQTVQDYVEELTGHYECQIIDEEHAVTDPPDYVQAEGSLIVGKENQDKSGLVTLTLTWSENTCKVERVFLPGEEITFPMPIGLTEAADRVKMWMEQQGKVLDDYFVRADEGLVWMDDIVCIAVDVYTKADHALVESYLVATQNGVLYRVDRETKVAAPLV